jgi:sRNA-binding regulator protein Hfq
MIKDSLNSILDNIKERATNPFLGTLIVVWTVHNWKLVYSIFYFESSFKLINRLEYIDKYFNDRPFVWNLFIVVGITILVLLFTYLMLTVSRLITDTQERMVLPLISKWTDKTSVVLKTEHFALQDVVKQLGARVEEERLAKVAAQAERDSIDKQLVEMRQSNQLLVGPKDLTGGPEVESPTLDLRRSDFNRIAEQIKPLGSEYINKSVNDILNGDGISKNDEVVKVFLREGLIKVSRQVNAFTNNYVLTEDGRSFLVYWNNSMR